MGDQLDAVDRALSAWNRHDLDTYLQLYSPEAIVTGYTPEPIGVDELRQRYEAFFAAFPDIRLERVDGLEDGQKVAVQFRMSGTHQGEFQGVPATGRSVEVEGMTILRFDGGGVVERASLVDQFGLMVQIGAISV